MPDGLESSRVPVVSGDSTTGIKPTNCAQMVPPHCELLVQATPLLGPR